jgi:PAS domain S-box-containing protein
VFALVCFGVLVSAFAFVTLRSLEVERSKAAFQRVAQERFDDLQSDLELTVSKVVAVAAFCESSGPVTRASFDSFVIPLYTGRDSGTQALEWAPRVTLSQREAFERAGRNSGMAGFEIRDRVSPRGAFIRAGVRPVYFPIFYAQPVASNKVVLGYDDLEHNSIRRETLDRADATGELTVSPRIVLVQETTDHSGYGIIIVRPAYHHDRSSFGRKALMGFAVGVLRLDDLVEKHGASSGVTLAITDLSGNPVSQQLYPFLGKLQPVSDFTQYRTISVGGRTWQLAASPMPGAFPVSKTYSFAGSALCLLFVLLVTAYVTETLDRRWQVERVVEARTGALNAALQSLAEVHRGLEENEARYRRLVEDSPNGIAVERDGKIALINRAAAEMFGCDPVGGVENRRLTDFVIPESRRYAEHVVRGLYAHGKQIPSRETQVVRCDGSILDVEVAASSFLHAGSQTIQVIIRDISQRKLAEAENARLVRAVEQVGEAIVITDLESNIVYVNPAFERVSGYSREEVIGKKPSVLRSDRHAPEYYAALWKALTSGESWSGQLINRAKSGRFFTEEVTISPIFNRSGRPINYVAVKRDVTLEIALQEQLHQSQKMDAIGRLAGGVAHDFNNMLMVIVSYADLIASSLPEDDPLRPHTAQILRAAQRSAALTRQLLAFSRKQVLTPQVLDCNTILAETSSMVRRLISENIELKCDFATGLWPARADADQIVQVILNLCLNSRDAMPNGGTLTLATRNHHVDQGYVELSVTDTGIGIPLDLQEKLFEPFFTTKERGKGTGLGLATVYGIVQQSGGHIRVLSAPGQGSTFAIYLPRCLETAASPELPSPKPCLPGRSRVLVVEDEDALREAITDQLQDHGYHVFAAADGITALDVLENNSNISILISDLIMPRMGGRELASLALKKLPHLRTIFMSGYANEESRQEDDAECPTELLQKPFSMHALLSRIDELSDRSGTAAD